MLSGRPALGIRFDVDKVDRGAYGVFCWSILWRAVDPARLGESSLWEGDTAASMQGRENVFCIGLQCTDEAVLQRARASLAQSEAFKSLSADPAFVEGHACQSEPLVEAGRVDATGALSEDAYNPRSGLEAATKAARDTPSPPASPPVAESAAAAPAMSGDRAPPLATAPVMNHETSAPTLPQARDAALSLIPTGHILIKEEVKGDGQEHRWEWHARDPQAHLREERERFADAVIVSESVDPKPPTKTERVYADSRKRARSTASQYGKPLTVKVIEKPRWRFPFRRVSGRFEVMVQPPPKVTIVYRRPARIAITSAGPEAVSGAREALRDRGGPIHSEFISQEQHEALLILAAFAQRGDVSAAAEAASLVSQAKRCVVDPGELSRYHGYQRQQTAAKILAIVGGADAIDALNEGLALQDRLGGQSGTSTYSTVNLVKDDIRSALSAIRTRAAVA